MKSIWISTKLASIFLYSIWACLQKQGLGGVQTCQLPSICMLNLDMNQLSCQLTRSPSTQTNSFDYPEGSVWLEVWCDNFYQLAHSNILSLGSLKFQRAWLRSMYCNHIWLWLDPRSSWIYWLGLWVQHIYLNYILVPKNSSNGFFRHQMQVFAPTSSYVSAIESYQGADNVYSHYRHGRKDTRILVLFNMSLLV